MNISVLAKLPSADVMAPAAVATRRIPQRGKEEAGESGPRCMREPRSAGPPTVPQRGGGLAGLRGGTGKRSREARTNGRPGLGKPAPSVGFKRPLSAPKVALSAERGCPSSPWDHLAVLAQPAAFAYPTHALPSAPPLSIKTENVPSRLQMRGPELEETGDVTRAPSPMQGAHLSKGLPASFCTYVRMETS